MEKLFKSTRGNQTPIDFYTSILQGIASDGDYLYLTSILRRKT